MDKAKYAKMFMKMARYNCMLLTALKAAKCVLTAAVVINALLSGVYIVCSLKK